MTEGLNLDLQNVNQCYGQLSKVCVLCRLLHAAVCPDGSCWQIGLTLRCVTQCIYLEIYIARSPAAEYVVHALQASAPHSLPHATTQAGSRAWGDVPLSDEE